MYKSPPIKQSIWVESKVYGLTFDTRLKIKILDCGLRIAMGIKGLDYDFELRFW